MGGRSRRPHASAQDGRNSTAGPRGREPRIENTEARAHVPAQASQHGPDVQAQRTGTSRTISAIIWRLAQARLRGHLGPVAPRWPPQGAPQHGELAGQRRGKVQNAQCVPATAVAYCVRASPARSRRFSRRGATLNPLTIFPPLITSVGEHVIAVYGDKLVMQLPSCGSRQEIDHSVRP